MEEYKIEKDLQKLIECDAFEITVREKQVLIPYMMNDAVECYIELDDCVIRGNVDRSFKYLMSFEMVENDGKQGIVLRNQDNVLVTIWYASVSRKLRLYQYHRIGHFWVAGDEKWRRIVYILGTLHDKLTFLGEKACHASEIELAKLMGFAPIRYFSPITESLDEYYENTEEGLLAFEKLAHSLCDVGLIRAVEEYKKKYDAEKKNTALTKRIATELGKSDKLYHYLDNQIEVASLNWDERRYSDQEELRNETLRKMVEREYMNQGYVGQYPVLERNGQRVVFYEEHPFVMREFEYDDFEFEINPLVF